MSSKAQENGGESLNIQQDGLTEEVEIADQVEIAPPPDGGYGWVCVAACFNINCFTWGVVSVRPTTIQLRPSF